MSKRLRHFMFVACASCALSLHLQSMALETKTRREWLAIVHHYNAGDCRVKFTTDAVSISDASGGVVTCKAPQWEICSYRAAEKIEWSIPLSKFDGINSANPLGRGAAKHKQLEKTGNGKIAGMRCTEWTDKEKFNSIIWLSDELPVAKQVPEAICRYFSMPIVDKIPMRAIMIPRGYEAMPRKMSGSADEWLNAREFSDSSHSKNSRLAFDTKSLAVVPFNAADFARPRGFKRVASGFDVLFSKKQSNEIVEMLDGIGFASSKSTRPKGKAP